MERFGTWAAKVHSHSVGQCMDHRVCNLVCIAIPPQHPENIPMKLSLRLSVTFTSFISLLQHNTRKTKRKGKREKYTNINVQRVSQLRDFRGRGNSRELHKIL
jgi:hypothetical protein